jgi:PqqD family protein of HPr-rel-A system
MKYQRNTSMDYLEVDDDNMVVFDPDSGDTHFLDGVGMDIMLILSDATEFDEIIAKLSAQYEADAAIMRGDVTDFIDELKGKKVVVEL